MFALLPFLIASTQIQGKAKLREYVKIDFIKILVLFIVLSLNLPLRLQKKFATLLGCTLKKKKKKTGK